MPYLGSEAVLPEASMPVALRGKLRNRFYEPILLLFALKEAYQHQHAQRVLEQVPDVNDQTPQQLLHDFMNKLAQICDNRPGGSTVTALVALQFPDRVQYRFATNQIKDGELKRVKAFIEDILNSLKTETEMDGQLQHHRLLRKIIYFNRPRLQAYVRSIHETSQRCLEAPEGSITTQIKEKLEKLREVSHKADDRSLEDPDFYSCCAQLMEFIRTLSKSEEYKLLRNKANADKTQESPWGHLRHAAGRLLTYLQSTRTLFAARKQWDSLFHNFEVVWLPSSTTIPNPISRKRVTAEDIMGRMTSDHDKATEYKTSPKDLYWLRMDDKIQSEAKNKCFRPYVHAEVLIHESIIRDPDLNLHASKFFHGYKYIGCSKPTCRLCFYYFAACEDGIQVRQTSRNLYHHWRAPDVYKGQGDEAVKRREDILNKMLVSIREDAFRTMDDKSPEWKRMDSNTDPTYYIGAGEGCAFEGDGIPHVNEEQHSVYNTETDDQSTPRASQEELTEAASGDEDDGGARL